MSDERLLLAPVPRRVAEMGSYARLPDEVTIAAALDDDTRLPVERVMDALRSVPASPRLVPVGTREAFLHLRTDPERLKHPQSYEIVSTESGVRVVGSDPAGLFYGAETLRQIIAACAPGRRFPLMRVEDRPDFLNRGVLLDVSRGRVPTMETLFTLVDRLASWKLNQLQLYTEHTFAYEGHETVWQGADPLRPEEIRELDVFCRHRHVELVPNQNSFGHMHRWLVHEPYRTLAECPDGIEHPFSAAREPFSLCPTDPRTLDFLAGLYDQLLPNFQSRLFNVGLDETIDLGLGRSADPCRARGRETVYLDFLRKVHALVTARGRRMMFWSDEIRKNPALLRDLPEGAIPLEWGYEEGHPFGENARALQAAGCESYVCPGTSSWNSFAGRTDNALANIDAAAREGLAHGASGLLVTDWGDNGHLQPLPVSYPGFLAAACRSWNAGSSIDRDELARLLDRHALMDGASRAGGALLDMGNAYRTTGARTPNGSPLFWTLMEPDIAADDPRIRGMEMRQLLETKETLADAGARLRGATPAGREGDLVLRELDWAREALAVSCDLAVARLKAGGFGAIPAGERKTLSRRLTGLAEALGPLWKARSRVAGLDEASGRLLAVSRAWS